MNYSCRSVGGVAFLSWGGDGKEFRGSRGGQCGPEGCPGHFTESGAHPSNATHCSSVAITFSGEAWGGGEGAGCSGPSFASWAAALHQDCDGQGVPLARAAIATGELWRR